MGPAKRGETVQVYWRIAADVLPLLAQLEKRPHSRGQYISELIRKAAQEAGLVERPARPIDAIQEDLARLQAEIAAIRAQEGEGGRSE